MPKRLGEPYHSGMSSEPAAAVAVRGTPSVRARLRPGLPHISLARRFLMVNMLILVVGGAAMGLWVGDQLERGIIDRSASITALYVDGFIEPHLASLGTGAWLRPTDMTELDRLLTGTPLGERVVSLRVWSTAGTILYSPVRDLVGQRFPVDGELQAAIDGQVIAHMSDLSNEENVYERQRWTRLLEMYIPVRERGTDRILAVAEFYQLPDEIDRQVGDARLASWAVVALAVAVSYLLLYGIVKRGSDTITRQERALERQVAELSTLLERNAALGDRVRVAAERTTTLNERALRRISADLHDGPGQTLALALLRLDMLRGTRPPDREPDAEIGDADHREVEGALQDALREMRAIAAGLRLPELKPLTIAEVASRAVANHTRRTQASVDLVVDGLPDQAALPVKIALFRCLQELLSNATRHAGGSGVRVAVRAGDGRLEAEVSDQGPGFDASVLPDSAGLGLAGIREQAELLGGGFELVSAPGAGTTVRAWWPLPPVPGLGAGRA